MNSIQVDLGQRSYNVQIGSGLLDEVGALIRPLFAGEKVMVVTDDKVGPLYVKRVIDSLKSCDLQTYSYMSPEGEIHKSLHSVERLYRLLHQMQLTRQDLIISLGGGVIGDLVGFVAATYMRGMPYVQIPTTLLAQVDASVGGKTAINLPFGKNMVGAFYQPKGVVIDPDVLATLKPIRYQEGLAEMIKYGMIMAPDLLDQLKKADFDHARLIARCVGLKAQVVSADELDQDQRRILNFGHTLGHAIETATEYALYTHGAAVACGMMAACRIGEALGITPSSVTQTLKAQLEDHDLPTAAAVELEFILEALKSDKKWLGRHLPVILLEDVGKPMIYPMDPQQLMDVVKETWVQAGVND